MRLGDGGDNSNFQDRTGQSGGGGGLGGGLIGLLLPLIASRFGIVGVLILGLGYCAFTSFGGMGGVGTTPATQGESRLTAEQRRVLVGTLNSTEQVWGQIFQASGATYKPTNMIAYTRGTQSGCGDAQAAMGPFYCPSDQSIYIDPQFFDELTTRFGAKGDFAQIYVVAHEVGHHIQNLQGTLDRAQSAQAQSSTAAGNAVQVGVELQADCFAGVWAKLSGGLEVGDIEEGMRAAEAIGDDMLTKGRVSPDNFTHGTSAQRREALNRGLSGGDPAQCNYAR